MKKIIVYHWASTYKDFDNTHASHLAEHPYSKEAREGLTNLILDKGFNVMLYQSEDTLTIFIDKKRFTQR